LQNLAGLTWLTWLPTRSALSTLSRLTGPEPTESPGPPRAAREDEAGPHRRTVVAHPHFLAVMATAAVVPATRMRAEDEASEEDDRHDEHRARRDSDPGRDLIEPVGLAPLRRLLDISRPICVGRWNGSDRGRRRLGLVMGCFAHNCMIHTRTTVAVR
jgi:hypothetical protein